MINLHLKANKQEGNFLTITEKQNAPRRDFMYIKTVSGWRFLRFRGGNRCDAVVHLYIFNTEDHTENTPISKKLGDLIGGQIDDQIDDQIDGQTDGQIDDQIEDQIGDQIGDPIGDQISCNSHAISMPFPRQSAPQAK